MPAAVCTVQISHLQWVIYKLYIGCFFNGIYYYLIFFMLFFFWFRDDNSVGNSEDDFDLSRVSQISWKPRCKIIILLFIIFLLLFVGTESHIFQDFLLYFFLKSLFYLCFRAFVYKRFLSNEECNHLIVLVKIISNLCHL